MSSIARPPFQLAPSARRSGGAEGNERLTAMTGMVLLIGLLVECYTIFRIDHLLTLHVFLGMLLLGPVTLKAGSVLYRFVRYYTGREPYRRKGPPALLLRVIGPVIMLLTACVFGSGIMLAVTGPGDTGSPGGWLQIHRISFIAWAFFIVIHVLAYVGRLPRLLAAEARGIARPEGAATGSAAARQHARRATEVLGGRGTRLALLTASLLAGLLIALLTVHLAGQWEPGPGGLRVSLLSPALPGSNQDGRRVSSTGAAASVRNDLKRSSSATGAADLAPACGWSRRGPRHRALAHRLACHRRAVSAVYTYVTQLGEVTRAAAAQGAKIVAPRYPEGRLTVATFRDPAGNVIGTWQQGVR